MVRMCGRMVLFSPMEQLISAAAKLLGVPETAITAPAGGPPPRYNVAPTTQIPALVEVAEGTWQILPTRWGLIAPWAKEIGRYATFNARMETAATKPTFRDAWKHGRCFIPMDGYYEWHTSEEGKKPYFVDTGAVMWAAGLFSTGLEQYSSTIVTEPSAAPIDWLHSRMPAFITDPVQAQAWLTHADLPACAPSGIRTTPADLAVGKVGNDYPELIGRH